MKPLDALRQFTTVAFHESDDRIVLTDCGRKQLVRWWRALSVRTVAEIGVWEGRFARDICAITGAHLTAVDPWAVQEGYLEVKNDKRRLDRAYEATKQALASYQHTIIRATSLEAAKQIPDRSLDAVFIDGNHLREPVLADISAWAPKVKHGGILSGHDFKIYQNKPFIEVFDAVNDYVREHSIAPLIAFNADNSPSWAWVVA